MIILLRMKKCTWNLSQTSLSRERLKIKNIFHKEHLSLGDQTMECSLTASTDSFLLGSINMEDWDMGMRRRSASSLSSSHLEIRRSSMPNAVISTLLQLPKMATYTHGDMGIMEGWDKVTTSSRDAILIVSFQRGQNKESKKLKS